MDRIRLAAELDPVEVCVYLVKAFVRLELHFLVGVIAVCPVGSGEGAGMIGLMRLYHKAHAHGLAVCLGKPERLAELRFCFASDHIFRIGKLGKNAVARAVDEYLCLYRAPCVGRELKSGHAFDPAVAALGGAAGAVEHKLDVLFGFYLAVKDRIPNRKVAVGVEVHIFKQEFLHNACLLEVAHARSRAGDPHPYLA